MKNDIFISYRRDGGLDFAKQLYDQLRKDNYTVTFDINTLGSGDLDTQIYKKIDQCKDFILIIDENAFDRCFDPYFDPDQDGLRKELAYALKKKKNIIPIFLPGISSFPSNLPDDINKVTKRATIQYHHYTHDDFYKALKKRFIRSQSKIGPLGWTIIIIGTLIAYTWLTESQKNNQTVVNEYVQTITEESDKNTSSDVLFIVNQFMNNHSSWNVFSENKALTPISEAHESDGTFHKDYLCSLSYRDNPLLVNNSDEAIKWRISIIGDQDKPMILFCFSESGINLGPKNFGQSIANDLYLELTGVDRDESSYYGIYENSDMFFLQYVELGDLGYYSVLEFAPSEMKSKLIIPGKNLDNN